MKKHSLAMCLALAISPAVVAVEIDPSDLTWKAITFGQSIDIDFQKTLNKTAMNVLSDNDVSNSTQKVQQLKALLD